MRTINGYELKIQDTSRLSNEERDYIRAKIGVFAISTKRVFDDPIRIEEDCMLSYYTRQECACETWKHVQNYLHRIGMADKVTITLVEKQLSLYWDETQKAE